MPPELSDPVYKEIVTARIKLLLEKPWFGGMATRLIAVEAPWCRTAATDGRHLYYNREFIKRLTRPQLLFLIGHEVLHCLPPGTVVPGSWKPIEALQPGDPVIGQGGRHSRVVMPMSRHYEGPMVTIKARGMLAQPMTAEHPVLVTRPPWKAGLVKNDIRQDRHEWTAPAWVPAAQVTASDWVQIPRAEGLPPENASDAAPKAAQGQPLDEAVALLLGAHAAQRPDNGRGAKRDRIALSFKPAHAGLAKRLAETLRRRFEAAVDAYADKTGAVRLFATSPSLSQWLRAHCGASPRARRMPDAVLHGSPRVLAAYLRGFTTSGTAVARNAACSTPSQVLALQVQMAWARFGVLCSLSQDRSPASFGPKARREQAAPSAPFDPMYRGQVPLEDALDVIGDPSDPDGAPGPAARRADFVAGRGDDARSAGVMPGAIFTPVVRVSAAPYSGPVHNIETTCHTFAAGNMMTHNCVFDHLGRPGGRDPQLWNMACLAHDTPIRMADNSEQPIQRVLPGDYVASPFGPSRVHGTLFSGVKETWRFGADGQTVRATGDHGFASPDGFQAAAELARRDGSSAYCLRDTPGFPDEDAFSAGARLGAEAMFAHAAGRPGSPRLLLLGDGPDSLRACPLVPGNAVDARELALVAETVAEARRKLAGDGDADALALSIAAATPGTVERPFAVAARSGDCEPVFDLLTEAGCFFANGILVHNCDYNINFTLVSEKVGVMPEGGLHDEKYTDEMSADEIYDLLKKGSVTIKLPLDDHLEISGDEDGSEDGDGPVDRSGSGGAREASVTVLGRDGPPKLTSADIQKIRNEVRAAAIQTQQQVGAGNTPLGVRRLIAELIEPKLDWRAMLDAHIRSQVKDDFTFNRLSRRTWATGTIMPAQSFADRVECVVLLDASASTTTEMVTHFMSETKGIMEGFGDFRVTLACFDTEVYNVHEITPDNFDDVYHYVVKGGGGTMFECIFEWLKAEGIEPHRLVIFTDGLPNATWGDPHYCDTLFVIHSNPHVRAPYGTSVHYEDDAQRVRH